MTSYIDTPSGAQRYWLVWCCVPVGVLLVSALVTRRLMACMKLSRDALARVLRHLIGRLPLQSAR